MRKVEVEERLTQNRAEKLRIESLSIIKISMQNFENLFTLHYRAKTSESAQTIKCLWDTVVDTAGKVSAASLMAYYSATAGVDNDAIESEKSYTDEASKTIR